MKQGKHSKSARSARPVTRSTAYGTSARSKATTKKTKKSSIDISSNSANVKLLPVTRIICAVQLLIMLAGFTYVAFLHLISLKFLIALAALIVFISALHILLIETRTRKIVLKVVSIILSVVISVTAIYGGVMLGTVNSALGNFGDTDDGGVIPPSNPEINITSHPFVVYLSGIDTRDVSTIKDKGLSDVNMMVAINPKTKKVLMVNIPRDYYVGLWGDPDKLDKLTHAGSHGIDCSIKTVEAIFDIKADYCVKVNFKSVVDIVDALGGITVNSEFKFTSDASLSGKFYDFNVGENFLKGDQALAFARERKSFQKGDIQRGIHQQVIIKAIFNKLISPSILNPAKLNDVLKAITSNMKTNISGSDIKALVRMQQNDMASWDIQTTYVEGTGTMRPTYSMGSQELSVKLPNKESIAAAKQAMEAILAE